MNGINAHPHLSTLVTLCAPLQLNQMSTFQSKMILHENLRTRNRVLIA